MHSGSFAGDGPTSGLGWMWSNKKKTECPRESVGKLDVAKAKRPIVSAVKGLAAENDLDVTDAE
jgi:hypothetical protein